MIVKKLHELLRKLFIISFKKHKIVWVISSIFILLSMASSLNLKFLVMMSDLLDKDFSTYEEFNQLNKDFDEENQVSVFISSKDGRPLSTKDHCLLVNWLTKVHISQLNLQRIYSSYGYRHVLSGNKSLKLTPVLVPDCNIEYTQKELKEQLTELSKSPSGMILTNKNQSDVFASFYLRNLEKGKGERFGHFNVSAFEELQRSYNENVDSSESNLEATWVGIGTYQYYLQKAYEQMNVLNVISGFVLLLAFKIFFGRWKAGFFLLGTYTVCIGIVYGLMASLGFPVDSLSAAAPIMLLIATLEDFVYFLFYFNRDKKIISSFQKIMLPSFYTSLTTALGFLTLCLSELTIIKRFGIICAFGAILEWIIIFLILPKILILLQKKYKTLELAKIPNWVETFCAFMTNLKLPKYLGLIGLIPFIYLILNPTKGFTILDSPEAVFPKSHIVRVATNKLLDSRGWKSEISLVFNELLDRSSQENIVGKILQKVPEFTNAESFQDTSEYLTRNVSKESKRKFIHRSFESSPASSRWISKKSYAERILLLSNTTDVVRINEIRKEVEIICKEKCYLANILVSYSEFGIKVLRTLSQSLVASIIIIILLLVFLCFHFKVKSKIPVIISALWGPLCLMFIFIFFDLGIYFATSVVMAVLVGLSGDNAIQFIFANKSDGSVVNGAKELGAGSVLAMMLMIILSTSFLISDFDGVRKIGLMMMSGFILGWLGDFLILQSLAKNND